MAILLLVDAAQTLRRGDDVGETDAQLVVHHHHFALRDEEAVDQHVQRFARHAGQFHNRSLCQLQQILDRHLGVSQFHGELHRDVQDHVQVVVRGRTTGATELLEHMWLYSGRSSIRTGLFRHGSAPVIRTDLFFGIFSHDSFLH